MLGMLITQFVLSMYDSNQLRLCRVASRLDQAQQVLKEGYINVLCAASCQLSKIHKQEMPFRDLAAQQLYR